MYPGREVGFIIKYGVERETLDTLQDGSEGAVGHLKCLDYLCYGAVGVEILLFRILHRHVGLRNAAYEEPPLLRFPDEAYGFIAAYRNGEYRSGKKHRIAQRQHREGIGQFRFVHMLQGVALKHGEDAHFGSRRECIFVSLHKIVKMSVNKGIMGPRAHIVNLRAKPEGSPTWQKKWM